MSVEISKKNQVKLASLAEEFVRRVDNSDTVRLWGINHTPDSIADRVNLFLSYLIEWSNDEPDPLQTQLCEILASIYTDSCA